MKETSKARHRSRTYLEHSCASVERNAPAGEKVQGLRAGVDFLEEVENFLVPRFRRQLGVHSQVSHDLEVGPHGVGEADQHRDFRDEPKGLVLLLEQKSLRSTQEKSSVDPTVNLLRSILLRGGAHRFNVDNLSPCIKQ